jgi:hypothetical protein
VRAWLAHELYHDIDMVNAQPTLCAQLFARHAIPAPRLKDYVDNRDAILAEVMEDCVVSRDAAEDLFIRTSFTHGCCAAWCTNHRVYSEDLPSFVKAFHAEMRANMREALLHYPICIALQESKDPDSPNPVGWDFAYLCQELERQCLVAMYEAARRDGHTVGALRNGSMLVRRQRGAEALGADVLVRWEQAVSTATGFVVKLAEKPMELNPAFQDNWPAQLCAARRVRPVSVRSR